MSLSTAYNSLATGMMLSSFRGNALGCAQCMTLLRITLLAVHY